MPYLFEHILNPLLGMSITAAFVAVVVILLRAILKRRAPKQVVCLLWLVVFARLLIPVMVQSPISLVPTALEDIVQTEQTEEPARAEESPDPGVADDAPVNSPAVPENSGSVVTTPSVPVVSQPVTGTSQPPAVSDPVAEESPVVEAPSVPEAPAEEAPAEELPAENTTPLWLYILPAVWLAGVAVMLAMGIGSYVKLRRRVFDAIRTEDGVWEHPSLASPFLLGLIRPKIYLPMGIEGQPRQFILHHERAHLRRLDHVVKPICWLALAIHWFNPLAWVAFLLMSRDIEAACDESVIRQLGSEVKADYSATLLALATDKRFPSPSPLSFGEGDAKARIKNVLNFKKPALWVTIVAVVVVIVAAVCLLTDPVEPETPPDYDAYTVSDAYPGLYFLEEPSSTVGTKITAYKLIDSELVLVGGYDEHLANNFCGLIGPDGEEEHLFLSPDEVYAMFEKLLTAALDPDWTPESEAVGNPAYTAIPDNAETLADIDIASLHMLENGSVLLRYGDDMIELKDFGYNPMRPDCRMWATDLNGDGVKQIHIIHQFGSGTGVSIDRLTTVTPTEQGLEVSYHDWSSLEALFEQGNHFTYYPEDNSISVTYEGQNLRVRLSDFYADLDWDSYGDSLSIATVANYTLNEDGTVTLSFTPALSDSSPMVHYLPMQINYTLVFKKVFTGQLQWNGTDFTLTADEPGLVVQPYTVTPLEDSLKDGCYTRFELTHNGNTVQFSGYHLAEQVREPDDDMLTYYFDMTGDGVPDPVVMLVALYGSGPVKRDVHVFDGVTLEEYDIPNLFTAAEEAFIFSGDEANFFITGEGLSVTVPRAEAVAFYSDFLQSHGLELELLDAMELMGEYYSVTEKDGMLCVTLSCLISYHELMGRLTYGSVNAYMTLVDGKLTPVKLTFTDSNGVESGQSLTTLASLPREIVTSATYPTDPEWYYKVAETGQYALYARNHGAEVMLTYGNLFWNFDHTAHTGRMNLPVMNELDDETVAVISEVNSGTGVSVKELVVYDTALPVATDYLYDWQPITDDFNQNNTLIYDKETNSLTLLWNGTAYFTGTLVEDLGQSLALEDGWTGKLLANGDIINFTHNGGNSFTVTVETAVAGRPLSIGAVGFDLTWNVEFTGSGFEASAPAITVTGKERTVLRAAFPDEGIYLFSVSGNGGEYYYLVAGGQLHKVPGLGPLTDYDLECQLADLDHDGQMELVAVGNHYAGSSSFGVLNVFDKGTDGWVHRRLTSYYSSEAIDYVSQYDGITMFDEAVFTPGSDPTQVTMSLGGFDLLLTVTDEMAAREGDYYVSGTSRSILWDGNDYFLHLHGSIHRRGGQYHWPNDDCGVTFRFVCRLTYNADGTFTQTPVGLVQTYDIPNQTLAAATKDFYAIRNDGAVIMWGSPEGTLTGSGLGNVSVSSPVELMGAYYGVGFPVFVDTGIYGGVMVVDTMGALYAHGIWADPNAPTQPVWLLGGVSMVSCGQFDTFVLREDGSLWSYGHNTTGLSTLNTMTVNGITWYKLMDGVLFVEAGGYGEGRVILSDHTLWAWKQTGMMVKVADNAAFCCDGRIIDLNGNLLDNDGSVLLTGVKYANCHYALRTDGALWALTDPDPDTLWGAGTPLEQPVRITDSVTEIASGEFESILLKTDGSLWKLAPDGTLTDITAALR